MLRAIQLPPLEFPKNGPPQESAGPARATCCLRHTSLERGLPMARHATVDGYRPRGSPKCLTRNDGHRPTALRLPLGLQQEPAGLRSPDATKSRLSREGQLGSSGRRGLITARAGTSGCAGAPLLEALGPRLTVSRLRDGRRTPEAPGRGGAPERFATGPTSQGLK